MIELGALILTGRTEQTHDAAARNPRESGALNLWSGACLTCFTSRH